MNEQKVKTTADRIRAMTDEELAENASMMACASCPIRSCDANRDECRDTWLAWLRAPAESEGETP